MKTPQLLIFGLIALFAFDLSAQTVPERMPTTSSRAIPNPTRVTDFEIRDQSDVPVQLSVDEEMKGRLPGAFVKLLNNGNSPIAAIVIRVDSDSLGHNSMMIFGLKGLAVGGTRTMGLPGSAMDTTSTPVASVDFVQFTDGTTWGPDALTRSRHIKLFLDGRDLAMGRLAELIAGQDDTNIRRAFDVYNGGSFGEPNSISLKNPPLMDFKARGYEGVIMVLRHVPKEKERGEDLARLLEVANRK